LEGVIVLGILAAMLMQSAPTPPPSGDWVRKPPVFRYYPERAQAERVEGVATLDCEVTPEGALQNCLVAAEDPPGWGFGATALQLATLFHMKPVANGTAPSSGRVEVPIRFKLPPGSGPPEKDPGRGPLS
jgi:TonB family protein